MDRDTLALSLVVLLLAPSASQVVNAEVSASDSDAIDALWIEPVSPTSANLITLYVSGVWPTGGYILEHTWSAVYGDFITLDMFWRVEGIIPLALDAYEYPEPIGQLDEGQYTARVRCWVNGELADEAVLEFEVAQGDRDHRWQRRPHRDWPLPDSP
jgi:hypothetical protein